MAILYSLLELSYIRSPISFGYHRCSMYYNKAVCCYCVCNVMYMLLYNDIVRVCVIVIMYNLVRS